MEHSVQESRTNKYSVKSAKQADYADMVKRGPTDRGRFFMTGDKKYLKEKEGTDQTQNDSLIGMATQIMGKVTKLGCLSKQDRNDLVKFLDRAIRLSCGEYPEEYASEKEIKAYAKYSTHLKKCKRCGKYFVAESGKTEYCSRPQKDGSTCRDVGAQEKYKKKVKTDPIKWEYKKFYANLYYKYGQRRITPEELDNQILLAKVRRDAIIREYGDNPPEEVVKEYREALRRK